MPLAHDGPAHKHLSREQAAALLLDTLKRQHIPFPYRGGWTQILSDFACLSTKRISNMASDARKIGKLRP